MAEASYPFGPDQVVGEDQWAKLAKLWSPSGIVAGSPLATLGTGLSFIAPAGTRAAIRGFGYDNDTGAVTKTASTNTSTQARIDRFVARLDRSGGTHSITLAIVQGTPGGTVPALTQTDTVYEVPIARANCPGSGSAQNYNGLFFDTQWLQLPDTVAVRQGQARAKYWSNTPTEFAGALKPMPFQQVTLSSPEVVPNADSSGFNLKRAGLWRVEGFLQFGQWSGFQNTTIARNGHSEAWGPSVRPVNVAGVTNIYWVGGDIECAIDDQVGLYLQSTVGGTTTGTSNDVKPHGQIALTWLRP